MRRSTLVAIVPFVVAAACGGRTALVLLEPDSSLDVDDASAVGSDVVVVGDASPSSDAARSLDAALVPRTSIDASHGDATVCPAGAGASAYLIATSGNVYRFDRVTAASTRIGRIDCESGAAPFTAAGATDGAVFVLYSSGALFRVDPATFACTRTTFEVATIGFPSLVGIAISPASGSDKLYVYGCVHGDGALCAPTLAVADLTTLDATIVAPLEPDPNAGFPLEVKGDAYGRLFACDASGRLFVVDPLTAHVLGTDDTGLAAGVANALVANGGDVLLFTGSTGAVHRYDLSTKGATSLGAVGEAITGAAAAPCMP